jgi:PAS domain S-box-containing protein
MTLRGFLARLVWACVIPMIVIAGYLAYENVKVARVEREMHASNRVRIAITQTDNHITFLVKAMQMLAASPHAVDPKQMPEFYEEAQRFRATFNSHLILADESMQMILNTRAPLGAALPKLPRPEGHAAAPTALATGKPAVGDMFLGPIGKEPLIAVVVPVLRDGVVKALLLSTVETWQFEEHLNKITLPPGWSLTLRDGKNDVIAERAMISAESARPGESVHYFARSANSPWSAELKVPAAEHRNALVKSVGLLAIAIFVAIVLSVFGGRLAGRRLERAIAGLARPQAEARQSSNHIAEIETVRSRITEAATTLRESEARYRELFEDSPQPMWVFDIARLSFLAVNDAAIDLLGYGRTEILSMSIKDIRPPEDIPTLMLHIEGIQNALNKPGIHRLRKKSGELIEADVTWHTLLFGGRKAAMVLVQDVTALRRAMISVQEQEAQFRALTEQSMVGIVIVAGGNVTYANQRTDEIFGYEAGESTGRSVEIFVVDADLPRIQQKLRSLFNNEVQELKDEFRGRRKDNTEIMVGAHGKIITINGHRVVIGMIQDITDKLRSEQTIHEYIQRLERSIASTVDAVSLMVELRDPYTAGHERRVGEISADIAAELGLDANVQRGLRIAGALHDVGKITVPAEILSKPSRLSPIEYELVRSHAQQGYEVLKGIDFPWPIAEVARQHHERIDGSGYPRGLKGEEILLEARIMAVADVVESMASHRPYRPSRGINEALGEIENGGGVRFDSNVVAACLRLFREKEYRIPE